MAVRTRLWAEPFRSAETAPERAEKTGLNGPVWWAVRGPGDGQTDTPYGQAPEKPPVSRKNGIRRKSPEWVVVMIPNCGHFPQVERPDVFVTALSQFLAEQGTT